MRPPEKMLFGEGCQTVNCSEMAKAVGCGSQTLRDWKQGRFPPQLRVFARICNIRGLTNEQIGEIVRKFI